MRGIHFGFCWSAWIKETVSRVGRFSSLMALILILSFVGGAAAHQEGGDDPNIWSARRYVHHILGHAVDLFGAEDAEGQAEKRGRGKGHVPGVSRLLRLGVRACKKESHPTLAFRALWEVYARAFAAAGWSAVERRRLLEQSRPLVIEHLENGYPAMIYLFMSKDPLDFATGVGNPTEELFVRAALDQLFRTTIMRIRKEDYARDRKAGAVMLTVGLSCFVEKDNNARLLSLMDHGYDIFTPDRRGPIGGPLSVISRHTSDKVSMERVRTTFQKAYQQGRIDPVTYAGLEDAYAIAYGGGRQIYGTYGRCRNGRFTPFPPLRDAAIALEFWKAAHAPSPYESCKAYALRQRQKR